MSDMGTGVYMTSANAPGEEKQIYRDDKAGRLADVSRDGKWDSASTSCRSPK